MRGEPECLLELTGQDLMGVPLSAPNCPHERIYVLPLLTILTNKVLRGIIYQLSIYSIDSSPDIFWVSSVVVLQGGQGMFRGHCSPSSPTR